MVVYLSMYELFVYNNCKKEELRARVKGLKTDLGRIFQRTKSANGSESKSESEPLSDTHKLYGNATSPNSSPKAVKPDDEHSHSTTAQHGFRTDKSPFPG
ncbi:hypothetical protein ACFE04_015816 [Oxalis oulophora]